MRKINIKIGLAILVFSLAVTSAFIAMMYYFQSSARVETDIFPAGIYALSEADLQYILVDGYPVELRLDGIIPVSEYNEGYFSQVFVGLLPVAGAFCLFVFVSSLALWLILRKIQRKDALLVTEQLSEISNNGSAVSSIPEIHAQYKKIENRFREHLGNYKRLNAYLSHEQKNAITLLRTEMELSANTSGLARLDYISDSIDDILTLSATADEKPKSTVDVALVCASVCDSYGKVFNKITFDFNEQENTEIFAKERWIYRAIANLLDNAVKYGNGKPVDVSVRAKKGSVIVRVEDRGLGISKDKLQKIFGHRYRINELNKDGYGIGLSLVSYVCDLCGGFVIAESEPGNGSVFYLSFPQKAFLG
jgi:signal transduction histidine kinase